MAIRDRFARYFDPFLALLLTMVALATLLPCRGETAIVFNQATHIAVALLFFLYGARLSRAAVVEGATHWRLHIVILCGTFVVFPLLGLAARVLVPWALSPELYYGIVFLCALPSTVQSSIAFTSIGRGNMPAAVCAASASSLIGIVLTPILVSLELTAHGGGLSWGGARDILLELLVPFLAGQAARSLIGAWLEHHKWLTKIVDRGSILMIVYVAFSDGVVHGIWHQVDARTLAGLAVTCVVILATVLTFTTLTARRFGFSPEDEVAIVFCGSKKSLATGIPMANVLFAGHAAGLIVLPLMLFHQLQLAVCAVLARRYARRPDAHPIPANATAGSRDALATR